MAINVDVLISHGAYSKKYKKGEVIFEEGNMPNYFYQVIEGEVKVYCVNSEGKELIQGIFKMNESFGEPPLFLDYTYPSSARAHTDCIIIRISKERFLSILREDPVISQELLTVFASRIYNKTITSQILLCHTPEQRILMFLERQKKLSGHDQKCLVPYTRQQIADITGLRVETVIRVLSKLNKLGKVDIINHKVHF